MSGSVERTWIDAAELGAEALRLEARGPWDPDVHAPSRAPDPYADLWAELAAAPPETFEFEEPVDDLEAGGEADTSPTCPILRAAEVGRKDPVQARKLLMEILQEGLRAIDAHAHLGNLYFDVLPTIAERHYAVGVAIGDRALGADFDGLLPWSHLGNRPFLRALHGNGLCRWRCGDFEGAERIFERMLR